MGSRVRSQEDASTLDLFLMNDLRIALLIHLFQADRWNSDESGHDDQQEGDWIRNVRAEVVAEGVVEAAGIAEADIQR